MREDARDHIGSVIFLPRVDNLDLAMIQQGQIYIAGHFTEQLACSLHMESRRQHLWNH